MFRKLTTTKTLIVEIARYLAEYLADQFNRILILLPTFFLQSLILWIAFNVSIGSITLFQLSFTQSFGFVFLIRVIRAILVNE